MHQNSNSLYDVLGIAPDASALEVRREFLRKAHQFHPDLNPDALESVDDQFKLIRQAYETLGDAGRREAYDRDLAELGKFGVPTRSETSRFRPSFGREAFFNSDRVLFAACVIAACGVLCLFVQYSISERNDYQPRSDSPAVSSATNDSDVNHSDQLPASHISEAKSNSPWDEMEASSRMLENGERREAIVGQVKPEHDSYDGWYNQATATLPTYPDTTKHTYVSLPEEESNNTAPQMESGEEFSPIPEFDYFAPADDLLTPTNSTSTPPFHSYVDPWQTQTPARPISDGTVAPANYLTSPLSEMTPGFSANGAFSSAMQMSPTVAPVDSIYGGTDVRPQNFMRTLKSHPTSPRSRNFSGFGSNRQRYQPPKFGSTLGSPSSFGNLPARGGLPTYGNPSSPRRSHYYNGGDNSGPPIRRPTLQRRF